VSIDRIPLPSTDGQLWLCGKRDVAPDPEAAMAVAGDASTVVCLNQVGELEHTYPDYVRWLRDHRARQALWFPLRDFRAESGDATIPFLKMIVDRLEAGESVLMHCAMGQGRAGTMAICLLIMLGATQEEAVRTVAAHRVFAGPQDSSQWALVEDVARSVASG
jgi:protein-tyrosine phosphatase